MVRCGPRLPSGATRSQLPTRAVAPYCRGPAGCAGGVIAAGFGSAGSARPESVVSERGLDRVVSGAAVLAGARPLAPPLLPPWLHSANSPTITRTAYLPTVMRPIARSLSGQ